MFGGARLSLPPAVSTESPSATRPNSGESAMKLTRGRRSPPKPSSTPVSRVTSIGASVVVDVVDVELVVLPNTSGATDPSPGTLVDEGGSVVVVVDVVVVVTSSTANPLGTVAGAVVEGVGSTSAITFTGTW